MLVYQFSTFCPLCLVLFSPACLLIFGFCPFCSFIPFSRKRHRELLHCKQDLLLHDKEYISSISNSAQCKFRAKIITYCPPNTFSPAHLIDFQKKIHPARLFHPARLLNFSKISTLLVYSILLFYSILESTVICISISYPNFLLFDICFDLSNPNP